MHLRTQLVSPTGSVYNELPAWLQTFIKVNKGKGISVFLKCDSEDRFLRLYVGLPMARQVGKLTLPVLICDGHHYQTASFTGVFSGLCSKDGYGNSVLRSFSIIPIENDRHLVWTVECCIRHGLRVDIYPILSDQGNFLHAGNSLQRSDNKVSHPYRKLLYHLIHICVQHYFFSINKQLKPLKAEENFIHKMIMDMSRAGDMDELFDMRSNLLTLGQKLVQAELLLLADLVEKY